MTNPVGTHHLGGKLQDPPTVCGSPHNADNNISHKGDGEGGQYLGLSDRTPTVQCVLSKISAPEIAKMTTEHSPVFSKTNHDALFFPEI